MRPTRPPRTNTTGRAVLQFFFFLTGLLAILAVGGTLAYRTFRASGLDLPVAVARSAVGNAAARPVDRDEAPTADDPAPESLHEDSLDAQLDLLLQEMTHAQESPMKPEVEDPLLLALGQSFAFSCTAEAYPVDRVVELIVLTDPLPVALKAQLLQTEPLPDGYKVIGRKVFWSADGGSLVPAVSTSQAMMVDSTATLDPGDGSDMITVRAKIEIEITQSTSASAEAPAIGPLCLEAVLHFLPPYSSSHLIDGLIDGYSVGQYLNPADPVQMAQYNIKADWYAKYPERYQVPDTFYKVTRQTQEMLIAPNQSLGMYAIDFPWKSLGMPQYIALDMHLVEKLEDLLALMRADGFAISRFVPIYGFRPPAFNLGTITSQSATTLKEPFSMHQYGRAIDLIIDEDGDGVLDDLNGDGVSDVYDAAIIMHYVNILDRQYREAGRMEMVGGAGLYTHNDFVERSQYLGLQSAYIHVDTRAFLTDHGTLVRWPTNWPNGELIEFGKI